MAYVEPDVGIQNKLTSFIQTWFIPADLRQSFGPDTPLLELGVLDSLNAARLLSFIRKEIGVKVSPEIIDSEHFTNVRSICAMIAARPSGD